MRASLAIADRKYPLVTGHSPCLPSHSNRTASSQPMLFLCSMRFLAESCPQSTGACTPLCCVTTICKHACRGYKPRILTHCCFCTPLCCCITTVCKQRTLTHCCFCTPLCCCVTTVCKQSLDTHSLLFLYSVVLLHHNRLQAELGHSLTAVSALKVPSM
jgi:hypothetical protein